MPDATMQKLTAADRETHSPDLVAENLAALKALFPELITEGADGVAVNLDVLKALVGDKTVTDVEEKYGLNWHGKRRARQLALTPSTGTLRPCPEDSVDWDTTQNLMIEGDNLEVLKLLQKSYAGKVKLIYIDPPYNTGKDFVYPDNFQDNINNYLELTGQTGEGGRKLSSNTEASGRFHTDWLNMMYPRLKMAWSLLRSDGVVFVSIDEKEVQHLRIVANELFGEETFVANVTVVTNMKGRNDKKHVAACHEQLVIYAKPRFVSFGLPLTEEQRAAFKHTDEAGQKYALRDLRKRGGPDKREDRPKMYFPIYWSADGSRVSLERQSVTDIEIFPLRGDGSDGCWRWGIDKVRTFLPWMHPKKSDRSGRLDVSHRVYLDPTIKLGDTIIEDDDEEDEGDEDEVIERTSKPKSIWLGPNFSSDSGKRSMKAFLPGDTFNYPKSVDLLRQCVQIGLGNDQVALDLFAGSGTLGQAVMDLNLSDGANRHFILVQLPEQLRIDEKDQKAAAKFCDQLGKPRNISELTKERLRRAGEKIREENPLFAGDLGFRVFKLDSSNIRAWDPDRDKIAETLEASIEHLKTDRTEQDILFELLLKLGLDLCVPIETRKVEGSATQEHCLHSIGGGSLLVCLSQSIPQVDVEPLAHALVSWYEELQPAGDTTVVFRDSAFADDVAKTNITAILQQQGLEAVRSL
jgi:adenine-specific DNA-methyltransferase